MKVSINIITGSNLSETTCRAMAAGIAQCGDSPVMRTDKDWKMSGFSAAVLWGFWEPCQKVVAECEKNNIPWVFIDLGYWGRTEYYKVTVNARHPTAYFQKVKHKPDRFSRHKITIKPWKLTGDYIILAGMSGKAAWSWGYTANQIESEFISELRKYTDRPIVYRPKPTWTTSTPLPGTLYDRLTPIEELLKNAWAVVTHHSNVGCDALVNGVPVFCKHGAASVLGTSDLSKIERPLYLPGREQWAADVAYCQWTPQEMRSGEVWKHLKEEGLIS